MSGLSEFFLGVIAVATFATAVIQIGVLVAAGRLAKRLQSVADQVEREIAPVLASVNAIGKDAARAASLATAQVERVDRLFGDASQRLDATLGAIQTAVAAPAREGAALMSGLSAALEALRLGLAQRRPSRSRATDDDDALFI